MVAAQTEHGTLLLKARQASALIGIPEQTLYEQAAAGRIPCLKLGRSVWFSRMELLAWIERETRGGNDDRAA